MYKGFYDTCTFRNTIGELTSVSMHRKWYLLFDVKCNFFKRLELVLRFSHNSIYILYRVKQFRGLIYFYIKKFLKDCIADSYADLYASEQNFPYRRMFSLRTKLLAQNENYRVKLIYEFLPFYPIRGLWVYVYIYTHTYFTYIYTHAPQEMRVPLAIFILFCKANLRLFPLLYVWYIYKGLCINIVMSALMHARGVHLNTYIHTYVNTHLHVSVFKRRMYIIT